MHPAVLLAFALAVLPLVLTPGVSFALVMSRVLDGGPAEGLKVAVGTACGLYVHATLAAAGPAALVMTSARTFAALRLVGACYLIVLGLAFLLRRERPPRRRLPWTGHGSLQQAFLGNVLNPKAAGVFLTLLPQFVDPARSLTPQIYLLATVQVAMGLVWLTGLSLLVATLGTAIRTPTWRTVMRKITAVVLVAFGTRTAVTTRTT